MSHSTWRDRRYAWGLAAVLVFCATYTAGLVLNPGAGVPLTREGYTPYPSDATVAPLYTLKGVGPLDGVAFSPDGKLIACATSSYCDSRASGGVHGASLSVWDAETGRPMSRTELGERTVWALAFSPDSSTLLSIEQPRAIEGKTKSIVLRDARALAQSRTIGRIGRSVRVMPCGVAFSPDGSSVAVPELGRDGRGLVRILDVTNGRLQRTLAGFTNGGIASIRYSDDGELVAVSAGRFPEGEELSVWRIRTGERTLLHDHVHPWIGATESRLSPAAFLPHAHTVIRGDVAFDLDARPRTPRSVAGRAWIPPSMAVYPPGMIEGFRPGISGRVLLRAETMELLGFEQRDVASGKLIRRWTGFEKSAYAEGVSPSNGLVAISDDRGWADLRVMQLR